MLDGRESTADELLGRARAGDVAVLSQMITSLESRTALGFALRAPLHAAAGKAHVLGVTGAPGSGKSTLVASLASELRRRGRTVGIVAVDPSSSLTGGAILGDRIRMQDHTLDEGIFVRSMSSRGSLGGVSAATIDAVTAIDASGWDVVIVETVGVGQADVEIIKIAQTTVVVSVPGLGDDVQAIKAGLLEVADVHVVNKADRPGADRTMRELLSMLMLGGGPAAGEWAAPVIPTSSVEQSGLAELADAIEGHMAWLRDSGELSRRDRSATAARLRAIAKDLLIERLQDPGQEGSFEDVVDQVLARRLEPNAAAAHLIDRLAERY